MIVDLILKVKIKLISLSYFMLKKFDNFVKDMKLENYWKSHFTPFQKKLLKDKTGFDLDG